MKVIRHTDRNYAAKLRDLTANTSLFDAEIEQRTTRGALVSNHASSKPHFASVPSLKLSISTPSVTSSTRREGATPLSASICTRASRSRAESPERRCA